MEMREKRVYSVIYKNDGEKLTIIMRLFIKRQTEPGELYCSTT